MYVCVSVTTFSAIACNNAPNMYISAVSAGHEKSLLRSEVTVIFVYAAKSAIFATVTLPFSAHVWF